MSWHPGAGERDVTTVLDLQRSKDEGRRFAMLTAYDYPTARILSQAGIRYLLVGDSLGMVVLGHSTTLPVTLEDMIHHGKAVARGAPDALLIGDLPFMSYQVSLEQAVTAAGRLIKEAGMHAVKLEGGGPAVVAVVRRLVEIGIPVMAHLGLTPQSVHRMGGFRVQGRSQEAAATMLAEARELEAAGAFSIVLEGIPTEVAGTVTEALRIPTIGIGAGPGCDGQVLVLHDLLGLTQGRTPRFVKRYAHLTDEITRAARQYAEEVESGQFPGPEHSYSADEPRLTRASEQH
jgi:3-methyl-2-oxobutanoate hydroxymethyltransferase